MTPGILLAPGWSISIHAPLAGSDGITVFLWCDFGVFQSTLPSRGATVPGSCQSPGSRDFNPRSPRGERPRNSPAWLTTTRFQSTLPSRGATKSVEQSTAGVSCPHPRRTISIHAPLAGSDPEGVGLLLPLHDFNPRSPRGERLQHPSGSGLAEDFNPRSPRGERLLHHE